jgi:hypothetical protein
MKSLSLKWMTSELSLDLGIGSVLEVESGSVMARPRAGHASNGRSYTTIRHRGRQRRRHWFCFGLCLGLRFGLLEVVRVGYRFAEVEVVWATVIPIVQIVKELVELVGGEILFNGGKRVAVKDSAEEVPADFAPTESFPEISGVHDAFKVRVVEVEAEDLSNLLEVVGKFSALCPIIFDEVVVESWVVADKLVYGDAVDKGKRVVVFAPRRELSRGHWAWGHWAWSFTGWMSNGLNK